MINESFSKALEESYLRELKKVTGELYLMYKAFIEAGFDKKEAMTLLLAMMHNVKDITNDGR